MNENKKTSVVAPYSELANEFEALKSSLTPCGAAAGCSVAIKIAARNNAKRR